MNELNLEQVNKMRDALDQLYSESETLINAIKCTPLASSIADIELREFHRPLSIKTAQDQAYLLIESAADYLSCLTKSLTEPVETIAPWSLTRSVLESASISIWIGSPKISSLKRAHRSLAFRLKGIQEQLKLENNETHNNEGIKKTFDKLKKVAEEIDAVIRMNKKGIPTRLGAHYPSSTDLCNSELGEGTTYRILSAMTHSQPFAIQQLSLKLQGKSKSDTERYTAEKHLANYSVAWLCNKSAFAFLRALCAHIKLYGYLTGEVISMFRTISDALKLKEDQFRFCIWEE